MISTMTNVEANNAPLSTVAASGEPGVHIRNVSSELDICQANIQGACSRGVSCDYHHFTLPYLWQILLEDTGWQNLMEESETIEKAYCNLKRRFSFEMPATATDGTPFVVKIEIDLNHMKACIRSCQQTAGGVIVTVRRLSTRSYANTASLLDESSPKYLTQWRWYWWSSTMRTHTLFSEEKRTPAQHVLESKYLSGQEIFRFEEKKDSGQQTASASPVTQVYLLKLQKMNMVCLNNNDHWDIVRRPLFIDSSSIKNGISLPNPPIKVSPFATPESWFPVDPDQQFELVPLNPTSMNYHLVASEFHVSLTTNSRKILDIFRVQNTFLWQQFMLKKTMMESKSPGRNVEKQLFHGTAEESVVQAICRQNFDWRLSGKHNIMFGKGTYFANDASYSDTYTTKRPGGHRWMFLARVLVGKYTKGNSSLVRPPPLDTAFPHGDLYDSCVNQPEKPSIFVIFDRDQCYPEYLISYSVT